MCVRKTEENTMASEAKSRLVEFLDREAFDPILKANPDRYPDSKKDKLRDVQRATESEKKRYHEYSSAEQVYRMYRDDLSSEPAQKIDRELRDLDLPTLKDVREKFERLASEVGVH